MVDAVRLDVLSNGNHPSFVRFKQSKMSHNYARKAKDIMAYSTNFKTVAIILARGIIRIGNVDDGYRIHCFISVSYTHLDVYKRQPIPCMAETNHPVQK